MGSMCMTDPNRQRLKQPTNSSTLHPMIVLDWRYWPNSRHVNFRDATSIISKNVQIVLADGECTSLLLDEDKGSGKTGFKSMQCKIKRMLNVYSVKIQTKQVWRFANDWMELNQRDTYMIGNTSYKLSRFVKQNNYRQHQISSIAQMSRVESRISYEDANIRCRICISSKQNEENPLISPCMCSGSIKYMHLKCLSRWLFGDISAQTNFISLEAKKAKCELCKTDFSDSQAYRKAISCVLSGDHQIAAPFIILQGRTRNREAGNTKNYMILSFAEKKKYKIGRSKDADICDKADPLISRINSLISEVDGRVFIRDNESKHGTSVLLANPVIISPQNSHENLLFQNINLQIAYKDSK